MEAGTCLASGPSFTGYAIVTIISDVVVALIPIPALLKLNVRLGRKIGLIVIFLLGLFTTICSIQRYLQINRIQFGDGNSTMLVLWGTIEFNVGVRYFLIFISIFIVILVLELVSFLSLDRLPSPRPPPGAHIFPCPALSLSVPYFTLVNPLTMRRPISLEHGVIPAIPSARLYSQGQSLP